MWDIKKLNVQLYNSSALQMAFRLPGSGGCAPSEYVSAVNHHPLCHNHRWKRCDAASAQQQSPPWTMWKSVRPRNMKEQKLLLQSSESFILRACMSLNWETTRGKQVLWAGLVAVVSRASASGCLPLSVCYHWSVHIYTHTPLCFNCGSISQWNSQRCSSVNAFQQSKGAHFQLRLRLRTSYLWWTVLDTKLYYWKRVKIQINISEVQRHCFFSCLFTLLQRVE